MRPRRRDDEAGDMPAWAASIIVIQLKISKHADSIGMYCKAKEGRWKPVRGDGDFQNVIGADVSEVFLFAYAADSRPVEATFLDFSVRKRW